MASTSAAEPPSAMTEFPNWVEMPDEVMANIFQRLPTVEALNSVRKVCTTWKRICKYPAMWKVINMVKRPVDGMDWHRGLEALTKEAVDLGCGELIDISIEWFATNDLLDYIVLRSNKLKRLCLLNCFGITGNAMSLAVKKVPQLEELHILDTNSVAKELGVIGRNCPHLKTLKMSKIVYETYNDHALAIADNMPELRHLELSDAEMTNDGLEAIINGCPHLETLDVRNCDSLDLGGSLGELCRKRIKDFKHGSTQNIEFHNLFYDVEDFCEEEMYDDFSESDFYQY